MTNPLQGLSALVGTVITLVNLMIVVRARTSFILGTNWGLRQERIHPRNVHHLGDLSVRTALHAHGRRFDALSAANPNAPFCLERNRQGRRRQFAQSPLAYQANLRPFTGSTE